MVKLATPFNNVQSGLGEKLTKSRGLYNGVMIKISGCRSFWNTFFAFSVGHFEKNWNANMSRTEGPSSVNLSTIILPARTFPKTRHDSTGSPLPNNNVIGPRPLPVSGIQGFEFFWIISIFSATVCSRLVTLTVLDVPWQRLPNAPLVTVKRPP